MCCLPLLSAVQLLPRYDTKIITIQVRPRSDGSSRIPRTSQKQKTTRNCAADSWTATCLGPTLSLWSWPRSTWMRRQQLLLIPWPPSVGRCQTQDPPTPQCRSVKSGCFVDVRPFHASAPYLNFYVAAVFVLLIWQLEPSVISFWLLLPLIPCNWSSMSDFVFYFLFTYSFSLSVHKSNWWIIICP